MNDECPAKTQISLGMRPVWSESPLYAQWVAKDLWFLHVDSEDFDQTERTDHFVGFVMAQILSDQSTLFAGRPKFCCAFAVNLDCVMFITLLWLLP